MSFGTTADLATLFQDHEKMDGREAMPQITRNRKMLAIKEHLVISIPVDAVVS